LTEHTFYAKQEFEHTFYAKQELRLTDFESLVPLAYVLTRLLLNPKAAISLSLGSISSYSLSPDAARQIADLSTTDTRPGTSSVG
jgi:hypothetical protein